jgi:hypothetical protein
MHTKVFTTSIGAVGALLFSVAASADPLAVKIVEPMPTVALRSAEPMRTAVLKEIDSAFALGDRIGEVRAGAECNEVAEREWSDLIRERVAQDLPRVFGEQLANANHITASESTHATPVEVSAFVNSMDLKICRAARGSWQGGIHVQVTWQVVAADSGRILYRASTEGAYALNEPRRASAAAGLREAFAVSVRNLLADRRFATLLQYRDGAHSRVAGSY